MELGAWLEQARVAMAAVWAMLSSPIALRVYFIGACIASLLASLAARRVQKKISDLAQGREAHPPSRRGRRATVADTLRRNLKDLNATQQSFLRELLARAALVVTFGHLLPTLGLFAATYCYSWLTMGGAMLTGPGGPVPAPTVMETALFCLTQLAGGGLADTLEVFGISWGALEADAGNRPVLALLVLYRLIVGAYAAILILTVHAMIVVRRNYRPRRDELEARLHAAVAAEAEG